MTFTDDIARLQNQVATILSSLDRAFDRIDGLEAAAIKPTIIVAESPMYTGQPVELAAEQETPVSRTELHEVVLERIDSIVAERDAALADAAKNKELKLDAERDLQNAKHEMTALSDTILIETRRANANQKDADDLYALRANQSPSWNGKTWKIVSTDCSYSKEKQRADAAEQELADLQAHERQTHETLGNILGTDDSLEACARRVSLDAERWRKWIALLGVKWLQTYSTTQVDAAIAAEKGTDDGN